MNVKINYFAEITDADKGYLEEMKRIEGEKHLVTIKTPSLVIQTNNIEKYKSLGGEYIITTNRNVSVPTRRGKKRENADGTYTIRTKDYELIKTIIENIWQ